MVHDVFDVYATIIKDTNEMNSRRRQLDSLYVTLITVILTGDAYVAFLSAFNNWFLVLVTIGVSLVGGAVTTRWSEGIRNLSHILDHRYEYLRALEKNPELERLGATIYTKEYKKFYEAKDNRFRSVTSRLQLTFTIVFVAIPLVLAALTAFETIPAIHALVPAQVVPYIRPLIPTPAP